MSYRELDLREGISIQKMLEEKQPVSRIAAEIGRHRSTVSREIRRNAFEDDELPYLNGYYGMNAQKYATQPVVDRLADHLKRSGKLFMDETTAPVLDPGRGTTKTGYLWALARDDRPWGGEDPPGMVYFYAPGRAGENGAASPR